MRLGRHPSIALVLLASACTPEIESTFDVGAYKTLVIGTRAPEGWRPVLVDLTQPEERDRIVYPWAAGDPPPLAYWKASLEELRIMRPEEAAGPEVCSAVRVRLRDADLVACQQDDGGTLGDCGPEPHYAREDWAVRALDWPDEPNPCAPFAPFDRHAVISFDVQTTIGEPAGHDVTAGAGTLAVSVGPRQVVLGQLSGWLDDRFPHPDNTEIGLFDTSALLTSSRAPIPRTSTKTSTAWLAGAPRAEGVAWLGSEHTALGSFDGNTGLLTAVIPPPSSGRIIDMDSDPADRERVLAATSSCSLHLREAGASTWLTLVPIVADLDGRRLEVCEPRVHFVGPGHALVVGLSPTLPGEAPPDHLRFRERIDRVIELRGSRIATRVMPWPPLELPLVGRSLRGVASFVDAAQVRQVVVGGAQYARLPSDSPPYDPGSGQALFFRRVADDPDAPWLPVALQLRETGLAGPVLIGDLHELVAQLDGRTFHGVMIGANDAIHVFDQVRASRGAAPAIAKLEQHWQPIAQYPLVTRVRPDGDGGFVIVTGDLYRNARVDLQKRFHWWRPMR